MINLIRIIRKLVAVSISQREAKLAKLKQANGDMHEQFRKRQQQLNEERLAKDIKYTNQKVALQSELDELNKFKNI